MTLAIFWSLVGVFVFIASMFFISAVRELVAGPFLFLLPFAVFFLLGGTLLFLTIKEKIEGILRKFLILTGASAVGFLVSIFLHNFFYAVTILTSQIAALHYLFEVLHTIFFFLAIPICPLGFLIGAVGSALLFIRKNKTKEGGEKNKKIKE